MKTISKIMTIFKSIYDSDSRFKLLYRFGFYNKLSDYEYLKLMFKAYMGKELDFNNPKTLNEKIQWLKLYNRKPEYTLMVDKYRVKEYVANKIGNEYIIPTLGVWEKFDEIDFKKLPNKFVLKTTHDSGGVVICRDIQNFDQKKAKHKLENSLNNNFYLINREWPYKDVKPRIIAEAYMEDKTNSDELTDYKFFCFNGEVKLMFIATDRQNREEDTKFDFYDECFNHLPFIQGHPNSKRELHKPVNFDKMKKLASILSEGIPFIRVDLYEINNKIYFGELTFYHFSGFEPIVPEKWDYKIGEWIKLPV